MVHFFFSRRLLTSSVLSFIRVSPPMDSSHSLQDTKYGSSPTSSSSSSVGGGPFNTSLSSRGGGGGGITDPSFPYFPPPFNPAFAAQFDVHAAASAIEHYPTFNYGTANGSSTSSPYGTTSGIHHQHASQSSNAFNTSSYDPYASAYAATAAAARHHHSILDAHHHHHHHHAAELYSRHSQHHQASATSLVDHTTRVSWKVSFFFALDDKSLDVVHSTTHNSGQAISPCTLNT